MSSQASLARPQAAMPEQSSHAIVELIELLFFAYRDFIAEPDEILTRHGFGRAHHRVVHFVGRNPGMRVSELLDILRITKQSLARVLRDLIEAGHVRQVEGPNDRRHRLLYLTEQGEALHAALIAPQIARVRNALAEAGAAADGDYRTVLFHLIDSNDRDHVTRLLAPTSASDNGRE